MKFRTIILCMITVFLMICCIASGEVTETDSISYDEWNWDKDAVNVFTGFIDLSRWSDMEITLEMKAVFEPESTSASETVPKFTRFNGSRLTMLEQRDNITCTPEAGQTAIEFSGSLRMPEKDHFQKITIELTAVDAEGKQLKKINATVSRGGNNASQSGNIFYIPFEIRTVAIIIAAAAALIWLMAIVRNRILNRK